MSTRTSKQPHTGIQLRWTNWHNAITRITGDIPTVFVANKAEEGGAFSRKKIRFEYVEISVKKDQNVEAPLLSLAQQLRENNALQFVLPTLFEGRQAFCIRNLSLDNVKDTLVVTHSHGFGYEPFEEACIDFVRNNAADLMRDPEFMALETEMPDLWEKLPDAFHGLD